MSQFSIICVIEAGRLEAQTLLMLNTLKSFGGALASSPIIAFQGRSGEPLSEVTHKTLQKMDVEYVFRPDLNHAPWFNYTNKIAAVRYAQEIFDTPWRIWLDSDILFLDRPSFITDTAIEGVDFCARFEYLPPAVSTVNDSFVPYWARVCEVCDVEFASLPFHELDFPNTVMKPFFNSGFFMWRADSGLAELYEQNFYRVLESRIGPKKMGPWIADQVSLTPTIKTLDLKWQMLSADDHLMMFSGALQRADFREAVSRANLVHYSKSREGSDAGIFDPLVLARRPELAALFDKFDASHFKQRGSLVAKGRKYARRFKQEIFARTYEEL